MTALTLRDVHRQFKQGARTVEVLKGVTIDVAPGEIVALLGPSGSGKTTLLQIAGLLEHPDAGEVAINGRVAGALSDAARTAIRRDGIGYVFQFHNLLADFTALENVVLPLKLAGIADAVSEPRATALLEAVGLKERLHHLPAELSGGEQQRVAIARAFANGPKLILADEPTGNLDSDTSALVLDIFMRAAREAGVGALVATHNTDLAARMDRRVYMRDGTVQPLD